MQNQLPLGSTPEDIDFTNISNSINSTSQSKSPDNHTIELGSTLDSLNFSQLEGLRGSSNTMNSSASVVVIESTASDSTNIDKVNQTPQKGKQKFKTTGIAQKQDITINNNAYKLRNSKKLSRSNSHIS